MSNLIMTGLEMAQTGHAAIAEKLATWIVGTGARNVSSGVIRCDTDPSRDVMVYSCHYDSTHWTGRGFKGFGNKHPGHPVPYVDDFR